MKWNLESLEKLIRTQWNSSAHQSNQNHNEKISKAFPMNLGYTVHGKATHQISATLKETSSILCKVNTHGFQVGKIALN